VDKTDALIIGGGIAGVTAAETVRRLAPDRSVVLVEHENHPLYSRVLLRDFVSGKIPREKVFLRTLDWYAARGIEYIPGTRVRSTNLKQKTTELSNGRTVAFTQLLLATGGYPRPWNIPGAELPGVLRFQTIEDADALKAACASAKRAVVVGGGFIGMDFIQAFVRAGIATTVLVRDKHYWHRFLDAESAGVIHDLLERSGVTIRFGVTVTRAIGDTHVKAVVGQDGAEYPADAIGLGIGIAPDLGFLTGSNVLGENGIPVNEYLETKEPGVLAAGDAVDFLDTSVDSHHRLGNWTNSVGHGRAAGRTLAGNRTRYEAVSAYTIEYLGLPIAFVGDCHPNPDNRPVIRGSRASGSIGQFLLRNGRLVGATLLNRAAERMAVAALIRSRADLSGRLTELADPTLSLGSLVEHP
jgi:NAD(P)H-nitrite reductase large subunit